MAADYLGKDPVAGTRMVKQQKERYLDPDSRAFEGYRAIVSGLKSAPMSIDPRQTLDNVRRHQDWQVAAFRQISDGFLDWLPRGSSGIKTQPATWADSNLQVRIADTVGLRLRSGKTIVVVPYLKEEELAKPTAEMVLVIVEDKIAEICPEATPVVLDTRRGREFKLRSNANRDILRASVHAQTSAYADCWARVA
ncbi:hypothetical protein [Sciscionella sediminilitoris]|uniref:hypothetical protein n=1 Tax=Sciscionella sediminilitoris TaxID=1445613 RepID=UPI00068B99C4|nr:hypothetical protein [Sciscionella sp. SE31]